MAKKYTGAFTDGSRMNRQALNISAGASVIQSSDCHFKGNA